MEEIVQANIPMGQPFVHEVDGSMIEIESYTTKKRTHVGA